jgi:DNA-binding MurR/RpiR family transcriptional regulator
VYLHPTTARVLRAIDDHADEGYSMTWSRIAESAGVSLSTLRRHRRALEDVDYISGGPAFGATIVQMSPDDGVDYECEEA